MFVKGKGYRVERKIKLLFQKYGWHVLRAGGSIGSADLICIKNKKCLLLQVKSTQKKTFYYYGYSDDTFEGFPFLLVVDFGYGKVRVLYPKKKTIPSDGTDIKEFLTANS